MLWDRKHATSSVAKIRQSLSIIPANADCIDQTYLDIQVSFKSRDVASHLNVVDHFVEIMTIADNRVFWISYFPCIMRHIYID